MMSGQAHNILLVHMHICYMVYVYESTHLFTYAYDDILIKYVEFRLIVMKR